MLPVALRTSDEKFTPRWVDVPPPSAAPVLSWRSTGYSAGTRLPGSFEVAYCLSDEAWAISPVSASVVINPAVSDWSVVGTTPSVPLWTRATGVLWVFRPVGEATWKVLGVDENRPHTWQAAKPYRAISGWNHAFGGQWLYPAETYPNLSDASYYPASTVLTTSPPAPTIRLLECPNNAYEVAYSWACNQGETALSPILSVPAVANIPATQHCPFTLLRVLANGEQPPQGALGMYVYLRKPGQQWHRQPCPDGHTDNLWALDVVMPPINQFVESGIQPGPVIGKSYLSSLHLALRDWSRDIIVDSDVTICCPLISEYKGATWDYQPRNHWLASFSLNEPGTWRLTVDGVQSGAMPRTNNLSGGWAQWQPVLDAAFGAGNVKISDYWPNFAPKIELTGKWATIDMTGKVSVEVKGAGVAVDSVIVGTQTGQGWVMSKADTKFKRKISTSNAGNWKVTDAAATPDNVTGYPMGWPMWVEFSQRTKLVGCDFLMKFSNCGIATADNSGGGCFHFNPVECSVGADPSNTRAVTYGFRCLGSSSWGNGGHLCSELIMEKVHLQGKFPLVCEGNQAANWQIRDGNFHGDGTFDSAIITQTNAGAITCGGRFTCDNARTLWASVWAQKLTIADIWIDGGMPSLANHSANSWGKLTINGGKINQWQDWMHAIESPAGSVEPYVQKLVTDNLDTQSNGAVQVKLCNPKPGQAVYAPKVPAEAPTLLQSLLP